MSTKRLPDESHEQYMERMTGEINKNVKSINTSVAVFFLLILLAIVVGSCSVLF